MVRKNIFAVGVHICSLLMSLGLYAQPIFPDFDAAFHRSRREALRQLLPPNSVAVLFTNPLRNRSNDVDFVFHPDTDFFYMTGFREPNAVLLIFSTPQKNNMGGTFSELLFLPDKDPKKELWNGKRLGVTEARKILGIDSILSHHDFKNLNINFQQFSGVYFKPFPEGVVDDLSEEADLYDLLQIFRKKAQIPDDFNPTLYETYAVLRKSTDKKIVWEMVKDSPLKLNPIIANYLKAKNEKEIEKLIATIPHTNLDATTLVYHLNTLRSFKTEKELVWLRKAISLSCVGQIEAMKAIHPDMSELEIQGIHEFVFRKGGAAFQGYPSIVGAGNNGCVLHYTESSRIRVGNDLVLMDVGAEYRGYTADVTRTVPASGKFSPEQRTIYTIVLEAQELAFQECKPGKPFFAPHYAAATHIARRLRELGITQKWEEYSRYFPHGTSHYLGLDVHDRGNYDTLQVGQVITVEPGIYIPEGSPCDRKWWGIGVRIEDDILITENGYENLSRFAPRKPEEIEALMAQPSALDDFILPSNDKF